MTEEQKQHEASEQVPELEAPEQEETRTPAADPPDDVAPPAAEPAQATAPAPSEEFDPKALPRVVWRIVKNPETGLGDAHVAGSAGLLNGLVLGGVSVIVIAISALTDDRALLVSWLGGAAFLVTGTLASLVLRSTIGKSREIDWRDDVFLIGGSLCYPLVGAILAWLIGLVPALGGVASAVGLTGFLLGAFAYAEGLVDVGRVDDSRKIWIAVIVLTVASAIGQTLDFFPIAT